MKNTTRNWTADDDERKFAIPLQQKIGSPKKLQQRKQKNLLPSSKGPLSTLFAGALIRYLHFRFLKFKSRTAAFRKKEGLDFRTAIERNAQAPHIHIIYFVFRIIFLNLKYLEHRQLNLSSNWELAGSSQYNSFSRGRLTVMSVSAANC